MRTARAILAIIAAVLLAVILIAPNVDLDDYREQPLHCLVVALLSLFLLISCVRPAINNGLTRAAYTPREIWLRSTPVVAAPSILIC